MAKRKSRLGEFFKKLGNAMTGEETKRLTEGEVYERIDNVRSKVSEEERVMKMLENKIEAEERRASESRRQQEENDRLIELINKKKAEIEERDRLASKIAMEMFKKEKANKVLAEAQRQVAVTKEAVNSGLSGSTLAVAMQQVAERLADGEIEQQDYIGISSGILNIYKANEQGKYENIDELIDDRVRFVMGARILQENFKK